MEFKEQLKKYQTIINTELEKYLRKEECPEKILNESVSYSLMAGGKRLGDRHSGCGICTGSSSPCLHKRGGQRYDPAPGLSSLY